jgi:endoglucanase
LLAGEFGASAALNPEARRAWLRLVRETCAANGIGWALWGYDDVMGFDIRRPPGNNPVLDHSVLEALGLSVP